MKINEKIIVNFNTEENTFSAFGVCKAKNCKKQFASLGNSWSK